MHSFVIEKNAHIAYNINIGSAPNDKAKEADA